MTKLDSLQGTWISSKDTNYKLVVIGNILMNLYENQNIDTSKFFLADTDSLPNVVMYDTTKVNGNYLILHSSGFAHIALSYKINYLSNESLELVYDNKYLPFDKQ
ncbi:MAG TPA: hypothetical protein PKJ70_06010 [Chitinophagaceae bacterium]|nr:hypothetical protein [Chitinophagaceae bacterium]HNN31424.1 hypothetical protein [Chitinophagaceae bacterium]